MKNKLLLLCVAASFIAYHLLHAQTHVRIFRVYDDAEHVAAIKTLIQGNKLDSAENYCYYLRKTDSIEIDHYNIALAVIYLQKGNRNDAYDIVLKDVDYQLALNAGAFNPFKMLCDADLGHSLVNDSLLSDVVYTKVKAYYKALDYPETSIGLKLIQLNYTANKLRANRDYQLLSYVPKSRQNAQSKIESIQKKYIEDQTPLFESLKELFQTNHQQLYSEYQIGTVKSDQLAIMNAFEDKAQHDYFDPILKSSLQANKIDAQTYVDYLTQGYRMSHSKASDQEIFKFQDSLCVVYSCTTVYRFEDKMVNIKHSPDGSITSDTFYIKPKKLN